MQPIFVSLPINGRPITVVVPSWPNFAACQDCVRQYLWFTHGPDDVKSNSKLRIWWLAGELREHPITDDSPMEYAHAYAHGFTFVYLGWNIPSPVPRMQEFILGRTYHNHSLSMIACMTLYDSTFLGLFVPSIGTIGLIGITVHTQTGALLYTTYMARQSLTTK